ncbi:MAG: ABC transporter ATP-binding protein [Paramuribaculum sp.]|nr:ABC transporter ATP-binding protein [Bacteroides sp.]MBD5374909.1 ABC transporter ATP-binding protein [Bacteroides sp.]MDE7459798.1 ABC transporter ATP-binding protein [Paramuribaculum sp.]
MIDIQNITFAYGRKSRPVVSDFSLRIDTGGIYGLLGRNGAGKSTLLYLIAGLLAPQKGSVSINGVNTRLRRPSTLEDIFIVPEEFSLPPISLGEYLRINSRFYPRFSNEDMRRNLETFELDPTINLGSLSMGQKKKAFMCFALACNTSLLLLDEPTNGLDIPGKSRFRKFVVSAMNDERTILISTHQVRDIDRILDHIIITDSNRVIFDRSVADTLSRLQFTTTENRAEAEDALFAQPSVGGSEIIIPNFDETETNLNLETLFEFALKNPELLNAQFTNINK